MHGTLSERITRSLAYMLRHQPEEFDLDLDDQGWGEMEEVVCALNERLGEPIEAEDVADALEGGDRQRYEINEDRIRALYGHSFHVEPGEPTEPPDLLYAGVGSRDASKAATQGLRPGRRSFVHLSLTEEDAREAGKRAAPEYVVLTIEAGDAWEEGIEFYDRISLFLSEEIPAEFIEVGEVQTDGIRRARGGFRRGGERGRGGGRGRGRRDGGGRRWERDHDDDRDESERSDRLARPKRTESGAPVESEKSSVPPSKKPARSKESESESGSGFGAGLS